MNQAFACRLLFSPLRWVPAAFHANGLSQVLNHLLRHQLAEGELDFLEGKVVTVEVTDIGLKLRLTLRQKRFVAATDRDREAVRFSGDLQTFLLLATCQEDPDSLFFQRRLRIQGETPTGLRLKNFIDAQGEGFLPAQLRGLLEQFTRFHRRNCGREEIRI